MIPAETIQQLTAELAKLRRELAALKEINRLQSDRIKRLEDELVGKP